MSALEVPPGSPFPLTCLPYGVFSRDDGRRRVGVAVGDRVLDVGALAAEQGRAEADALAATTLNPFMALGRPAWTAVRSWLTEAVAGPVEAVEEHLTPMSDLRLHLPFEVADYVDFYASEQHALNVGAIFRPDSPSLPTAWRQLPIGYHGRSGTVVVSGTDVVRPCGLRVPPGAAGPAYGPSLRLDIEAEVGFVVGVASTLGEQVPVERFADHVFGVVLVNDWSARDIQAFEYVPLGPFLGKSFATSVSPWVVPLDALEAARVEPPARDPDPAGYLRETEPWGLDLALEVRWNGTLVSRPPFATMYWTAAQQLAHLTVNGASLRTGDLYASGTVSGASREQRGSFLELTWSGREPVSLDDGSTRGFLEDGDTVRITAWAPGADGTPIGFGEVVGTVQPATC